MKIIFDILGMAVACIACAVVFCGLQCLILSSHVYESFVGSES